MDADLLAGGDSSNAWVGSIRSPPRIDMAGLVFAMLDGSRTEGWPDIAFSLCPEHEWRKWPPKSNWFGEIMRFPRKDCLLGSFPSGRVSRIPNHANADWSVMKVGQAVRGVNWKGRVWAK